MTADQPKPVVVLPRSVADQIEAADRAIEQAVRELAAARQHKRDLLRSIAEREDVYIDVPEMKS